MISLLNYTCNYFNNEKFVLLLKMFRKFKNGFKIFMNSWNNMDTYSPIHTS